MANSIKQQYYHLVWVHARRSRGQPLVAVDVVRAIRTKPAHLVPEVWFVHTLVSLPWAIGTKRRWQRETSG
jgi:hypothetical protein